MHLASAEHVQVQMGDRLSGARAVVHHRPVAVGDAALGGDLGCQQVDMAQNCAVLRTRFAERHEVLARDDQHVRGRLRIEVLKGHGVFVLVNDARRNLAGGDLAKNTFSHGRDYTSTGESGGALRLDGAARDRMKLGEGDSSP